MCGEAGENPKFGDLMKPGIENVKTLECRVQRYEIRDVNTDQIGLIERNFVPGASAFLRVALARMFDQSPAHGSRHGGEEMGAVGILFRAAFGQAQEHFVNKFGRLPRVMGTLTMKLLSRYAAQFWVRLPHPLRWILRLGSLGFR